MSRQTGPGKGKWFVGPAVIDGPSFANHSRRMISDRTCAPQLPPPVQARQVVLIRFRGQLTENDFVGLDKLASDTGDKAAFDCIFDMTAVEKVE